MRRGECHPLDNSLHNDGDHCVMEKLHYGYDHMTSTGTIRITCSPAPARRTCSDLEEQEVVKHGTTVKTRVPPHCFYSKICAGCLAAI